MTDTNPKLLSLAKPLFAGKPYPRYDQVLEMVRQVLEELQNWWNTKDNERYILLVSHMEKAYTASKGNFPVMDRKGEWIDFFWWLRLKTLADRFKEFESLEDAYKAFLEEKPKYKPSKESV